MLSVKRKHRKSENGVKIVKGKGLNSPKNCCQPYQTVSATKNQVGIIYKRHTHSWLPKETNKPNFSKSKGCKICGKINLEKFRKKYCGIECFKISRRTERHKNKKLSNRIYYLKKKMRELGYEKEKKPTKNITAFFFFFGALKNSRIPLVYNNTELVFFKTNIPPWDQKKEKLISYLFQKERKEFLRPLQIKKFLFWVKMKAEILSLFDNPRLIVLGFQDQDGRPRPIGSAKWGGIDYLCGMDLVYALCKYEEVLVKVENPALDMDANKKDKDGNYKIKKEWLQKALVVDGKKLRILINKYKIPYYFTTNTLGNYLVPLPFIFSEKMIRGGSIYHPETGEKVGDLLGLGDLVALPEGRNSNRKIVITKWGYKLVEKYGIEGINHRELYLGKVEDLVEEMLNFIYLSQYKSKPTKSKKTYSKSVSINLLSASPTNRLVSEKERKVVNATFKGIKKDYIFDRGKPIHKIRLSVDSVKKDCFIHSYHRKKYAELFEKGEIKIGSNVDLVLLGGRSLDFIDRIVN